MSLRTFRLKVRKSIKSTLPGGSIELWLRMGDETLVPMESSHDDQNLDWWGLDNNSLVIFYMNHDHA